MFKQSTEESENFSAYVGMTKSFSLYLKKKKKKKKRERDDVESRAE